MDTHQIKAFIAIAETGSFSSAALRLHLTQPAISKRIALLEESLQTSLFNRVGRQVLLTQAGQRLLPHARQILAEINSATQALDELKGDIGGTLSIATSHHIGIHYLPPYLAQFCARYPKVKLDLHFLDSEVAYQEILNGRFDFALVTLPRDADARLHTHALWQDRLVFVTAPTHPLAAHDELHLADLSAVGAVLPDARTHTTLLIKQLFDHKGLALNIDTVTNHLDAIKMLLSVGLGWGMLPERLVDHSLVALPLALDPIYRPLGYIHHRQRQHSRATQAFYQLLESHDPSSINPRFTI